MGMERTLIMVLSDCPLRRYHPHAFALAQYTPGMSDSESPHRRRAVADRLEYTMSGVTPWINWKTDSTCEGYALMLQQLLAISDILVIYVSGAARDGCGHAWLIVYLREINWRIIDVTITDTGFGEVFTYEKHEPIFSYSHGVNNHDIY